WTVMVVAGGVVGRVVPVMRRIWLPMPGPKWCISMGACASGGGVFDTYAVVQGIDRFIPVDVYVPGCPPRPEQLIRSILDLQEKVKQTGTVLGAEFKERTEYECPRPLAIDTPQEKTIVAPGNYTTATRLWD